MCDSILEHMLKACNCHEHDQEPASQDLLKSFGGEKKTGLTKAVPASATWQLEQGRLQDEELEAARQRHHDEVMNGYPAQPAPQPQAQRMRTTTTTTKVEEYGPVSGAPNASQSYGEEAMPSSSVPAPYGVTPTLSRAEAGPTTPEPPFEANRASSGMRYEEEEFARAEALAQLKREEVRAKYGLEEAELAYRRAKEAFKIRQKEEELRQKREELEGEDYLREMLESNQSTPMDSTEVARQNPQVGGQVQSEESVEDMTLQKPRYQENGLPERDLSHVISPMLTDIQDGSAPWLPENAQISPQSPPSKISASPGISGSSGVYHVGSNQVVNLKSISILKSRDGHHSSQFWLTKAWTVPDGKALYLEGIASSTNLDRDGDIMSRSILEDFLEDIKGGKVGVFFDHTHDHMNMLGQVTAGEIDSNGMLKFEARLQSPDTSPAVKDLIAKLDEGFVLGTSIGGDLNDYHMAYDSKTGKNARFLDHGELFEISVVPIPANADAQVLGLLEKCRRCSA